MYRKSPQRCFDRTGMMGIEGRGNPSNAILVYKSHHPAEVYCQPWRVWSCHGSRWEIHLFPQHGIVSGPRFVNGESVVIQTSRNHKKLRVTMPTLLQDIRAYWEIYGTMMVNNFHFFCGPPIRKATTRRLWNGAENGPLTMSIIYIYHQTINVNKD